MGREKGDLKLGKTKQISRRRQIIEPKFQNFLSKDIDKLVIRRLCIDDRGATPINIRSCFIACNLEGEPAMYLCLS